MNKRQAKKKRKLEELQVEIWGYPMSYREQREMERKYHEYIVSTYCRSKGYDYEAEEFAMIVGIDYVYEEHRYNYPNRMRYKTMIKLEGGLKHG